MIAFYGKINLKQNRNCNVISAMTKSIYYKDIASDEKLRGQNKSLLKEATLYVPPEVFVLLEDDDIKDILLEQLEMEDELYEDKDVKVYEDGVFMGEAFILKYPVDDRPGFALVRFYDKRVMKTDFMVSVERLKSL